LEEIILVDVGILQEISGLVSFSYMMGYVGFLEVQQLASSA